MSTKLGTERERAKSFFFFTAEETKRKKRRGEGEKEKIKRGVSAFCAYFGVHSEAVDTATSVCAST